MKNYDETVGSVFTRINQYEVEKKARRKRYVRTVASLCCCCLVAALGIGLWQSDWFVTTPPVIVGGETTAPQVTQGTNPPSSTEPESPPELPVVWGDGGAEDMGLQTWRGKTISCSLYDVMFDKKNEGCRIAVEVGFYLDNDFVYNGKTITQYEEERDREHHRNGGLTTLLTFGEYLKYGETLYITGAPADATGPLAGVIWAKHYYEEIVGNIDEDLLEKYIVDGEFLREKLEYDLQNGAWKTSCLRAYEEACEAYQETAIEKAIEVAESQGIYCVSYRKWGQKRLLMYITVEQLADLSLEYKPYFGIALKDGEGEDF